jgi:hypothetical protein
MAHRTAITNNAFAGVSLGATRTNFVYDGLNPLEEKDEVTFGDGEVTSPSVCQTSRLIASCAKFTMILNG